MTSGIPLHPNKTVIYEEHMQRAYAFLMTVKEFGNSWTTKQYQDYFDMMFDSPVRKDIRMIIQSYCPDRYRNIVDRIRA